MPLVGLGTWQMMGARCQAAVRSALEVGYRIRVSTAEAQRLLVGLVWWTPPGVRQVLWWSWWRRRHQARARRCHWRRRRQRRAELAGATGA